MEKPNSVTIAVRLLWSSLVIALGGLAYLCTDKDVSQALRGAGTPEATAMVALILGGSLLVLAVCAFFIYKIGKGRNWARLIFCGLVFIGTPGTVTGLFDPKEDMVVKVIMFVQLVVQLVAVVMLMQKDAVAWYKPPKAKHVEVTNPSA